MKKPLATSIPLLQALNPSPPVNAGTSSQQTYTSCKAKPLAWLDCQCVASPLFVQLMAQALSFSMDTGSIFADMP